MFNTKKYINVNNALCRAVLPACLQIKIGDLISYFTI